MYFVPVIHFICYVVMPIVGLWISLAVRSQRGTVHAFAGPGMIIASFVKDEEMAGNAASIISFPMMFLSSSLFLVDQMPWFLQIVAKISPLTYPNDGLRAAMVTGNGSVILTCMAIIGVLAFMFFGLGVVTLKWKDD